MSATKISSVRKKPNIGELSEPQARALLRWHLTHDRSGSPWATFKVLIRKGYLEQPTEKGLRMGLYLLLTPKGIIFCDKHHMEINLNHKGEK